MPRHAPLPPEYVRHPFSTRLARVRGVGKRRLDSPDLSAPYRGVRSTSAAIPSVEDQAAAYAPRLSEGQFFSHITAARLWHLPTPRKFLATEPIHVSTPDRVNRVRTAGVTAHRLAPPTHRVQTLGRVRVSDAVSTWVQLASILSLDALVAVGDALVLDPVFPDRDAPAPRPYATPEELRLRVEAFRGPGKRRLLEALELVRLGVESPKETELRLLIIRSGMPEPAVNVLIHGTRSPFVPRVDLVYAEWKVLVEYDGEQHREDPEQFERDQRRAADLRAAGYTLITVRKEGLSRSGRQRTVTEIRDALVASGWRP
ncbi:hypothetical protein B7R54_16365 [Subtercola boreus]|uniref:DUF559 domain-containing protein n=1 Tax=Subtercola boreus TaxID=120213 RepID=A0A3E0VKW1_9MICO|nr:DUF559 domain-containing protein [Subtercola boreus]RFA10602.1 hypothetical protein B7R54_16365 [Subtercola boreus]TQL55848.1 uncharacterized protein DUF559 [Subtercola boreus]